MSKGRWCIPLAFQIPLLLLLLLLLLLFSLQIAIRRFTVLLLHLLVRHNGLLRLPARLPTT